MKTLLLITFILLTIGCNDSKKSNEKKILSLADTLNIAVTEDLKSKEKIIKQNDSKGTNLEVVSTPTNCGLTFDDFFERFSKDSIFQKGRVKYPLKESYAEDLESTTMQVDMINASEYYYKDFTLDKDAMNNEFGKYNISIEKINDFSIYYKHLGYDNGIYVIYKFNLIEGCWLLVEIEDKSA